MGILHGLAVSIFGWLHDNLPSPPTFWTDATNAINTVFGIVPSAVRYFVPVAPLVVAALALIAIQVTLGLLRLARRVLSLFTGGGGMA